MAHLPKNLQKWSDRGISSHPRTPPPPPLLIKRPSSKIPNAGAAHPEKHSMPVMRFQPQNLTAMPHHCPTT
ncbi:hypothetical protein TorRG33x02_245220 [Trema orientale]|uniref:Uncharacterized protein n=1 Tax=Trema orientale TaxID=63057 RepID=A0A2P5DQ63_TREOI|nr:hypothetical protein TorRG33x02_245220 [Trema orientale]